MNLGFDPCYATKSFYFVNKAALSSDGIVATEDFHTCCILMTLSMLAVNLDLNFASIYHFVT